ncbi:unnamed protein product [Absidia cylindrospora]
MLYNRLNSAEQLKAVLPSWKKDLENDVEFKRFYQYAFGFGKTNGQKSMDVDVALALWTLLLDENSNHTSSFIEFIRTTKPVKVINKGKQSLLYRNMTECKKLTLFFLPFYRSMVKFIGLYTNCTQ